MEHHFKITYYKPEKQGIFSYGTGYRFAVEMSRKEECGILLYDKNGQKFKIPFSEEGKQGTLYGIQIEDGDIASCRYRYYEGKRVFTDSYARGITGLETWGKFGEKKREPFGRISLSPFDWEGDVPLRLPYADTVIYGLNVRSFTMHKSSGVKNKGTFEGAAEKIPYLKELGITAVELMPAYEYDECMYPEQEAPRSMSEAARTCTSPGKPEKRVNCWGFQKGFYFAPKAAYSKEKPEISFKKMVREFHRAGIEVYMHFYFPPAVGQAYMLEVLKYWVMEYHIDGARLSGFHIPFTAIAQEPVLKETKLRSSYFPIEEIYGEDIPSYRNLAADNGNFKNDMRRYLKGDENLINEVVFYHKNNPKTNAVVNYLADYDGFSLFDSVAYERKHNEANGENGSDGTDCNYSWNCGAEGECRKKAIQELRLKQIKNALSFLFLSQGVPYLFSGDEFGCTRHGNNNAYCQDNETGWIKWKHTLFSEEILKFTRFLIHFRKEHPVLHQETECRVMDVIGCGYPDISYHGMEAWRPDMTYISRMVGIMLYGQYAKPKEDASFYIAYNMHWEIHELALPKLPKGMKWGRVYDTSKEAVKEVPGEENKILMPGRCVSLYCSIPDGAQEEKEKKKKERPVKKQKKDI